MSHRRIPTSPGFVQRLRSGELVSYSSSYRRHKPGDPVTCYGVYPRTGLPCFYADGEPMEVTALVVEVVRDHDPNSSTPYLVKLMIPRINLDVS